MNSLWHPTCPCATCRQVYATHARQDAERDAAELLEFPPITEADLEPHPEYFDTDGTVERCEACGTFTANQWGLCTKCSWRVDDFDDRRFPERTGIWD